MHVHVHVHVHVHDTYEEASARPLEHTHIYMYHVPSHQVQFIDGRFKSFSCRSSPNELPVVGDSLGAGHGA